MLAQKLEENYGVNHVPARDVDAALHEIAMKSGLRDFLHEIRFTTATAPAAVLAIEALLAVEGAGRTKSSVFGQGRLDSVRGAFC
jgi:uncharacterized protein YjfI (DUF2170 family)